MKRKWWQDTIIYQVYIRSFKDGNGDGIGDFQGIISKLNYFKDLGVGALWISPHYKSPMDDNGYDVSDYYQVSEDYGNIDDVKQLIQKAHDLDIKIIFDLVLNHTSDEHPWFQAAKNPKHKDHKKYHDYYIWHKPKYDESGNRLKPTKWLSWFGGSVWDYNEPTDEYYLHIFSKKMPDLNWRSEAMVNDLKKVTKWLIDLGVDGFRVDAANHLEKNWNFPDAYPGYEHFSSLPKHHEYLEMFGKELFVPNDILAIGEAGGATKEEAIKYCGFDHNEFDLLIHFGHCWADLDFANKITPGKWAKGTLSVKAVKESFNHWYQMLKGVGWNLVYWHNHDHPRIVSHYGNDEMYHVVSAKMLCHALYFMPGTAIVYQGEEIGMTNVDYQSLDEFKDVEVFTEYDNFINFGASHEVAMQALRDRARDNARTPYQWNDKEYAGFSVIEPWIKENGNYKAINLSSQINDDDSIFSTYKTVFKMRKDYLVSDGNIKFIDIENDDTYIYVNQTDTVEILSISNFRAYPVRVKLDISLKGYETVLTNYQKSSLKKEMYLLPYESIVAIKRRAC
jgi:glycosidase